MTVPIGTIFRIVTLGIIPLCELIAKRVRARRARRKAAKAKLQAECEALRLKQRERIAETGPK